MKLACTKLMLVDELLTYKAFGRPAVNECSHWCAFHSGVVCEGDTQGILLGEKYVVWEKGSDKGGAGDCGGFVLCEVE